MLLGDDSKGAVRQGRDVIPSHDRAFGICTAIPGCLSSSEAGCWEIVRSQDSWSAVAIDVRVGPSVRRDGGDGPPGSVTAIAGVTATEDIAFGRIKAANGEGHVALGRIGRDGTHADHTVIGEVADSVENLRHWGVGRHRTRAGAKVVRGTRAGKAHGCCQRISSAEICQRTGGNICGSAHVIAGHVGGRDSPAVGDRRGGGPMVVVSDPVGDLCAGHAGHGQPCGCNQPTT